jgi:hypothetical protein
MTVRYAIVGRWYTDPRHSIDQNQHLHNAIVPDLSMRPGFLAAYWTLDPESGRTHAIILFADELSARNYKASLVANRQPAAHVGVTEDYLIVAEVLAEAHPHRPAD